MARALTTAQAKELLGRKFVNDWEADEIEVNYDHKLVAEYDEFNEVYMDKKTRLLIQALEALESTGGLDFAVLKHPELGTTWGKYIERREAHRKKLAAIEKLKSTFSREEMQLLGIETLVK